MKKITLIGMLLALCCLMAPAAEPINLDTNTSPPTLSGPLIDGINLLATGTNWAIAPYGLYSTDKERYGAGVAAVYNITPNFASGVGIDYMDSQLWMPSGQVQMQLPIVIASQVTMTPLAYSGISTAISGDGEDNGEVVGIFGAGMAAKIWGDYQGNHLSVFYSIEKRTGFDGEWMRFGIYYRF